MLLIALVIVAVAGVGLFAFQGVKSQRGSAPGLVSGQLARCPASPNCQCSEYPDDGTHFTAPVAIASGDPDVVWRRLRAAIVQLGGEVVGEQPGYIAAQFSSRLFRFVDDVEARLDSSNGVIHIRSASRVGHSDLGANAKRVQAIRDAMDAG